MRENFDVDCDETGIDMLNESKVDMTNSGIFNLKAYKTQERNAIRALSRQNQTLQSFKIKTPK